MIVLEEGQERKDPPQGEEVSREQEIAWEIVGKKGWRGKTYGHELLNLALLQALVEFALLGGGEAGRVSQSFRFSRPCFYIFWNVAEHTLPFRC